MRFTAPPLHRSDTAMNHPAPSPRFAPFLLAAFVFVPIVLAQEDAWRLYENPRFGFVIPVPPGMRNERPPDNGDGQSFVSRDGRIRLAAWGSFNVDGFDDVEARWKEELAVEGRTVTYKRKTAGWFVVSGIEADGSHFYLRHSADSKHSAGWLMTYPASDEARASAWIERIAKGYEARLGKGADRIE
jgi:hypothetical protein